MSDSLGIITNMVSASEELPVQTLRFIWQSAARQLLPNERVAQCLRVMVPGKTRVDILHSPTRKRANYGNLWTCARLWQCPVCAARISEHRRKTLSSQLAILPYQPIMITYTVRHNRQQTLTELIKLVGTAKKKFRQGRAWQRLEKEYGLVAAVRALEDTHGESGWHVHMHELVLMQSDLGLRLIDLTHELKERWIATVQKLGGDADYDHGLAVTASSDDVADYVAKIGKDDFLTASTWKLEHEITKSVVKLGRAGGRTANQLLHDYRFNSDLRAGMLWKEHATAFKGRKQLVPSSFAALLGQEDDPDDGVLAEGQDNDAVLLAFLDWHQWQVVLMHEYRGQLLDVARTGDFDTLADFLQPLGIHLQRPEHIEKVNDL